MKRGGNIQSHGLTGDMGTLRSVLVATGGQAKLRELYQILSPAEAAEFLGLALQTVRNMTSRGELLGIRHGKKVIGYRLIDLIAWQEAQKQLAVV
jgi:excisionase family DNA binding protein